MINYSIGRYWDISKNKALCIYTDHNQSVFFDTEENAFKHLNRIIEKTGKKYEVFRLFPIGTYFNDDPF